MSYDNNKMDGDQKTVAWVVGFVCAVVISIAGAIAATTIATNGPHECQIGHTQVEGAKTIYLCD